MRCDADFCEQRNYSYWRNIYGRIYDGYEAHLLLR